MNVWALLSAAFSAYLAAGALYLVSERPDGKVRF